MINRIYLLAFFILNFSFIGFSQKKEVNYEIGALSSISTESTLPFWMVSNKNGIVPNQNNALIDVSLFSEFRPKYKGIDFSYGASFIGSKANNSDLIIGQFYGGIQWKSLQLILGSKYEDELFGGLSSSNGDILNSKNARAFPGINFQLADFVNLPFGPKCLTVKMSWAEYILNDTRIVDQAHLHHKSLFLKLKTSERIEITAGLDDYAQWGGESATLGKQASGFKDYIRVVTGASGGSNALETDQINALGNHIGAYYFNLSHKGRSLDWSFYWSHPFEDRSGRELSNFPDGLYGLFLDLKKEKNWITHLLYEYYYTKDQSGRYGFFIDENGVGHIKSGGDNYFNNGVYASGWTFFGRTIGSPFFTPAVEGTDGITHGVMNNRFVAHHLGVKGYIGKCLPYRVMLSYSKNFGRYSVPLKNTPEQFSGYFEVQVPEGKLPFEISLGAAGDLGNYLKDNYGVYIRLCKRGIF